MAGSDTTALPVASRPVEGSRATRRLRRRGMVPGVVYGGTGEPKAFEVEAKLLRNTLAHSAP
jgi:large subunit ribosomal protein L25